MTRLGFRHGVRRYLDWCRHPLEDRIHSVPVLRTFRPNPSSIQPHAHKDSSDKDHDNEEEHDEEAKRAVV